MTLYESNFIRLGWLVGDARQLPSRALSEVPDDCPLELAVVDRAPYTTTATLSYLFDERGLTVREPGLEFRVYHDARLVEATAIRARPATFDRLGVSVPRSADSRWPGNVLLNKWLEYATERGHRFAAAPA
jgi:uncharacterized protein YqiB (DUF1249 family)